MQSMAISYGGLGGNQNGKNRKIKDERRYIQYAGVRSISLTTTIKSS